MNPERLAMAERLASRGYAIITSRDKLTDGKLVFLVEHPELDGCMAQGATLDDALAELRDATVEYIYYLLEDGFAVPDPLKSETITSLSDTAHQDAFSISPIWEMRNDPATDDEREEDGPVQGQEREALRFSVIDQSIQSN